MIRGENKTAADRAARIEILSVPGDLDLATSDGVAERGYAALARSATVLLDLTGLSFCDARGLGTFVRIANQADAAGCRFGLILAYGPGRDGGHGDPPDRRQPRHQEGEDGQTGDDPRR